MNTIAKPGTLLRIEQGDYSDYSIIGFFVVLSPFDPYQELKEYLIANPEQAKRYSFEKDAFLAALLAKGYLLEIAHGELHLGSYGSSDINWTPLP